MVEVGSIELFQARYTSVNKKIDRVTPFSQLRSSIRSKVNDMLEPPVSI